MLTTFFPHKYDSMQDTKLLCLCISVYCISVYFCVLELFLDFAPNRVDIHSWNSGLGFSRLPWCSRVAFAWY